MEYMDAKVACGNGKYMEVASINKTDEVAYENN
jgi:hypothetical protein